MTHFASCDLCKLLDGAGLDSVLIWSDEQLAVVLVDEPGYPGFCRVVWRDHVKEMTDLDAAQRQHIMDVVWSVERAQRDVMAPEKVNLASFGNMTPHVHWHVIPRYRDDAHFPSPSWATTQRSTPEATLAARIAMLPALRAAIVAALNPI